MDPCNNRHLGESFVQSHFERCSFQDEGHFGSLPHSFPGLCQMRSEMSPEQFRSGPVFTRSKETHQFGKESLKCGYQS